MLRNTKARLGATAALTAVLALGVVGCAPNAGTTTEGEGGQDATEVVTNDTASKGEYTAYDPALEAEHDSGSEIAGSEEEKLQQERIAGGAGGAVVSENLEPLEGITDSPEGEYVPTYGIELQAPAVCGNGADCLTCHENADTEMAQPQQPNNHVTAKLTEGDCASCHADAE